MRKNTQKRRHFILSLVFCIALTFIFTPVLAVSAETLNNPVISVNPSEATSHGVLQGEYVSLSWNSVPDAEGYRIQVTSINNLDPPYSSNINLGNVTSYQWMAPYYGYVAYKIEVIAYKTGWTSGSSAVYITVGMSKFMDFNINNPANGADVPYDDVYVSWDMPFDQLYGQDPEMYIVEVYDMTETDSPLVYDYWTSNGYETDCTIPSSYLTTGHQYRITVSPVRSQYLWTFSETFFNVE